MTKKNCVGLVRQDLLPSLILFRLGILPKCIIVTSRSRITFSLKVLESILLSMRFKNKTNNRMETNQNFKDRNTISDFLMLFAISYIHAMQEVLGAWRTVSLYQLRPILTGKVSSKSTQY